MMYHLKFSLTGGASCSVGCSPPGSCASGICSSTAMSLCLLRASLSCYRAFAAPACGPEGGLTGGEVMDELRDSLANHVIHQCEVSRKDEDRHNHDGGGGL